MKVLIEAQRLSTDRYKIQLSLQDTSTGISNNLMNRLFKPFRQADMSNHRKYGGTGLVLAISKYQV